MCMTVETLPCEAGENVHVETFNVDIVLQIQETILARHNFEFDILNRLITKQNRISKCECIFLALVMGRPTCMKRSPLPHSHKFCPWSQQSPTHPTLYFY